VHERQGEHESQWAAITSIAAKIGGTAEMSLLRKTIRIVAVWVGNWKQLITYQLPIVYEKRATGDRFVGIASGDAARA
jgi:hypothetical protein